MVKNFVGNGAQTRDLVFHEKARKKVVRIVLQSALLKWLLGMIILSPDLFDLVTIILSGVILTKT